MDTIIKGIFTMFCALILSYLVMGIVSASITSRDAATFLDSSVATIQQSHFSPEAINECKSDASAAGYDLKVSTYHQNGDKESLYGTATLKYKFVIPLVGYDNDHTIAMAIQ